MKYFILIALLIISACTTIEETHGANLRKMNISKIGPESTREEVQKILGSPSTKSSYGQETWYYINNEQKQRIIGEDEMISQDIMAISFNELGTVDNVQVYGLDDAKKFNFVKDTTPTAGHDLTVMEQLLGNMGKFNPKMPEQN